MEDLDLNVPDMTGADRPSKLVPVMLSAAVLLLAGIVALLGFRLSRIAVRNAGGPGDTPLAAETLKELAVKLETRGVPEESARFWEAYIISPGLERRDRASGAFRLGQLHQAERQWGKSLSCYYRADSLSTDAELSANIGRRIQECLEGMGAVSALSRELKERTTLDRDRPEDEVCVAEIAGQKYYRSDLEQLVESEIDMQLGSLGAQPSDPRLARERERLIKESTSPAALKNRLSSFVIEEMLSREARRKGLDGDEEIQSRLRHIERQMLARKALMQEVGAQLRVTPTDVQNHYRANPDKFTEPAAVTFCYVTVSDREAALLIQEKTRETGGLAAGTLAGMTTEIKQSDGWMKAADDWKIDISSGSRRDVLASGVGEIMRLPLESEDGFIVLEVTGIREKKVLSLAEIREQVERDLVQLKASEAQGEYLRVLRDRYDVVIYGSALVPGGEKQTLPVESGRRAPAPASPGSATGGPDLL